MVRAKGTSYNPLNTTFDYISIYGNDDQIKTAPISIGDNAFIVGGVIILKGVVG